MSAQNAVRAIIGMAAGSDSEVSAGGEATAIGNNHGIGVLVGADPVGFWNHGGGRTIDGGGLKVHDDPGSWPAHEPDGWGAHWTVADLGIEASAEG